jgi:phosphatidate cytidylyltransferase
MKSRLIYGWALFIIAIGTLLAGGLTFSIFWSIVDVIGGNEYIAMLNAKGIKPSPRVIRYVSLAFFVLASSPSIAAHLPSPYRETLSGTFAIEHYPLLLTIGVCFCFFRLLFRHEDPPATIADIASTVLGVIYIGWLPSHIILLRNLVPPGQTVALNPLHQAGLAYAWVFLFIVFATDVFAFYAGKAFGKHLLYPQVSPKKTVEGAVAGFIGGMFWATVVVYLSDNYIFANHPFANNLWQAPLMGAFVSIASQLGDLCESLLKRDAGVKDSGTIIPGHGGVLDRGDGMIFASAVTYYWISTVVLRIL